MGRVMFDTPFDGFLTRNRIRLSRVSRLSGYSLTHIRRVRMNPAAGSPRFRVSIAKALSTILRRPVANEEIFGLDDAVSSSE